MGQSLEAPPGAPPTDGAPGGPKWGAILRGSVAILFGLIVLAWPSITLHVLVLAFSVFAIIAGVFAILGSMRTKHSRDRWLHLGEGVVAVLAGIVAIVWPGITVFALSYIVAAWAMVTGVMEMAGAFQTRLVSLPEWMLLASGAISIVFGILLLVWPYMGVLALAWLIGIYAIIYGILHLYLAFTGASAKKATAA